MPDSATLAMQDRGPTVLAVVIAFLCVSTGFIVLRLVSRIGVVKRVSNDDYAIVVAWVSHIKFPLSNRCPWLMDGSLWLLVSPSPYATEQAWDSAVTKQMLQHTTANL